MVQCPAKLWRQLWGKRGEKKVKHISDFSTLACPTEWVFFRLYVITTLLLIAFTRSEFLLDVISESGSCCSLGVKVGFFFLLQFHWQSSRYFPCRWLLRDRRSWLDLAKSRVRFGELGVKRCSRLLPCCVSQDQAAVCLFSPGPRSWARRSGAAGTCCAWCTRSRSAGPSPSRPTRASAGSGLSSAPWTASLAAPRTLWCSLSAPSTVTGTWGFSPPGEILPSQIPSQGWKGALQSKPSPKAGSPWGGGRGAHPYAWNASIERLGDLPKELCCCFATLIPRVEVDSSCFSLWPTGKCLNKYPTLCFWIQKVKLDNWILSCSPQVLPLL